MPRPRMTSLLAPIPLAAALLAACTPAEVRPPGRLYEAPEYGLSLTYPEHLHLVEKLEGPGGEPWLALVLVEDTPMHRAYLAGTVTEPMEGPPMITVDVYHNPRALAPAEWIAARTNWILTDKRPQRVRFGERNYLVFFWDGLYAGKSAVVGEGEFTYVFSVTWITHKDRLLADFHDIMDSVRLITRGREEQSA